MFEMLVIAVDAPLILIKLMQSSVLSKGEHIEYSTWVSGDMEFLFECTTCNLMSERII